MWRKRVGIGPGVGVGLGYSPTGGGSGSAPAPGDILSVTVNPGGETVDVVLLGLDTGGTYAFGLGTNNAITGVGVAPKFEINVTSLGYDDAGDPTVIGRTIFGTRAERTPFDTRYIAGSYTSGTFVEDETITQAVTGATARVVIPGSSGPRIYACVWTGSPNSSNIWTGGTSGATFTPTATPVQWGASSTDPGPREFYDGTNTTVRIRLSDIVYEKDNSGSGKSGFPCTATFLSGFYTSGVTPTAAVTDRSTTNNSTVAYTKTLGDWTWGHYERVTGSDFRLRCVAFQGDAHSGCPVSCVKFTVTDGTNTVTEIVTTMAIDTDVSTDDAQSGAEYFADIDLSTLTQGAVLTANFVAYPWVGDSTSLLDTSAGAAPPSPLVGPRKFLNDKSNTYGVTMALVDPAGNDATGVAYDSATYNYLTAAPFLTLGKAAAAIAAYNNTNRSRNDVGAGIIECNDGSYNNLGSSNSYGSTPNAVITIRPSPGASAYGVKISGQSGNNNISGRTKIESIEITSTTNNTWSTANVYIWLHNCKFNSGSNTPFNGTGMVIHVTQGEAPVWNTGFRGFSTGSTYWSLVRGVDLTGFTKNIFCYTVCFNKRMTKSGTTVNLLIDGVSGYTGLQSVPIVYNNALYGLEANGGDIIGFGSFASNTTGMVFVQNIIENTNGSGSPIGSIGSSDAINTNTPLENYIVWHNVVVGQRCFFGYNDAGTITKYRRYWSVKNNYFDRAANKNDVFSPGNANRIGPWSVSNSTRGSGNFWAMNMVSLPGPNFWFEFAGLSSFQPAVSSASDVAKFVSLQATTGSAGTTAGAGNGDYHLQSISPLIDLPIDQVLCFDIEGTPRTLGDAAGAYTYS